MIWCVQTFDRSCIFLKFVFLCPSYRDRKFNQMAREAVGSWQGAPGPVHGGPGPTPLPGAEGGEAEAMSNAQRSTLKWEKEETLGELATVAPVLYTNVNFPSLKDEFPGVCVTVTSLCISSHYHDFIYN